MKVDFGIMGRAVCMGLVAGLTVTVVGQVVPPTSVPVEESWSEVFAPVRGAVTLDGKERWNDFRFVVEYDAPEAADPRVILFGDREIDLPPGENRRVEVACEHVANRPARIRVWHEGKLVEGGRDLPGTAVQEGSFVATEDESQEKFRFDRDFTVMVKFATKKGGTLVAKAPAEGKWVPDAKALFIRGGRLVYDIGWLGDVVGKRKVDDGKSHVAVLVVEGGEAALFTDGKRERSEQEFTRPDKRGHVFKLGSAAADFGGDYEGEIHNVRFWKRALNAGEIEKLGTGREDEVNTPDFNWLPPETKGEVPLGTKIGITAGGGFVLKRAVVQPLAASDHRELVGGWDRGSHERGKKVYQQLCATCHGTVEQPGTLPTALRFHEGEFRNGNDPYRMFQTLEKGYGMMVAQPQYTTRQKYDVIHYLREEFLKERNPSQFAAVGDDYLEQLPRGKSLVEEKQRAEQLPPYKLMDFGNVMFWTLEVEEGNIAQKGIAVRVDPGPGGISKGRAWMLYDHDTMRLAACWTGEEFVDWRGIAWDGSHGTHTSIVGEKHFVFPNEPAWANPVTGEFEDLRILGRDGKPYGPLPRDWVRFKSVMYLGDKAAMSYAVGGREIVEFPTLTDSGSFKRVLGVAPSETPLKLRLSEDKVHEIPASKDDIRLAITYSSDGVNAWEESKGAGEIVTELKGPRFPGTLTTRIEPGGTDGPFAVDVLTPPSPQNNPWQSWMRVSGFDFFDDGKRAAVCTWNGDVWIVEGIDQSEGELKWTRSCAGLFQPLGLKIVDGQIFVGCRDMIVLLGLGKDGETMSVNCFNSDHQVTEHFHEFAMGLQTDEEGNFYYAKSARHALKAVVPHHGTLLRVAKDGSRTDILATGFRAANGVCLNPDGSFIVTDQEGHWNPKNRINWVAGTGPDDFYGNIYGYHDVTDESDEAMEPPLCWITNAFDRSPSELLWVPEKAGWGPLNGSLLNLSYGYGKIFVVPHESVDGTMQGGMCQLPIEQFPTGVMRGRFHPGDGQLYACGMFAWGGNQKQAGGFYRVRATGKPAYLPVGLEAAKGKLRITFSDPLDAEVAAEPKRYLVEAWDLKRSKNYGSKHYNQRRWEVESVRVSADRKTVTLAIPEIEPTWGMSIECGLEGADGQEFERVIHNSIHVLGE